MECFDEGGDFRPNPIGLSSVRLLGIEKEEGNGLVLQVAGADLLDGTPIYDIKPYLPHVDSHPEATGGFAGEVKDYKLEVECEEQLLKRIPAEKRTALLGILSQDPRPAYQNDEKRVYGMKFSGFNINFSVKNGILKVLQIES